MCYLNWHDYLSLVEGESHGILLYYTKIALCIHFHNINAKAMDLPIASDASNIDPLSLQRMVLIHGLLIELFLQTSTPNYSNSSNNFFLDRILF